MTKLTTERLEKFVNDIKTDGMCDITDSQVESALIRLFAYEQAAKNPVAWVVGDEEIADFKNGREVCVMRDCDDEQLDYLPLYAAPVLPKQPEPRNEIMAKGVEAFAKDWKGSASYSRISEMACNFAAKLRNGDADEC